MKKEKKVSSYNRAVLGKRIRARGKRKISFGILGLFVAGLILAIALLSLVMSSFGLFEKRSIESFDVRDECSLIPGFGLIHQIRDGGECRNRCVNECGVRELTFMDFEFLAIEGDCNSCLCTCD